MFAFAGYNVEHLYLARLGIGGSHQLSIAGQSGASASWRSFEQLQHAFFGQVPDLHAFVADALNQAVGPEQGAASSIFAGANLLSGGNIEDADLVIAASRDQRLAV